MPYKDTSNLTGRQARHERTYQTEIEHLHHSLEENDLTLSVEKTALWGWALMKAGSKPAIVNGREVRINPYNLSWWKNRGQSAKHLRQALRFLLETGLIRSLDPKGIPETGSLPVLIVDWPERHIRPDDRDSTAVSKALFLSPDAGVERRRSIFFAQIPAILKKFLLLKFLFFFNYPNKKNPSPGPPQSRITKSQEIGQFNFSGFFEPERWTLEPVTISASGNGFRQAGNSFRNHRSLDRETIPPKQYSSTPYSTPPGDDDGPATPLEEYGRTLNRADLADAFGPDEAASARMNLLWAALRDNPVPRAEVLEILQEIKTAKNIQSRCRVLCYRLRHWTPEPPKPDRPKSDRKTVRKGRVRKCVATYHEGSPYIYTENENESFLCGRCKNDARNRAASEALQKS